MRKFIKAVFRIVLILFAFLLLLSGILYIPAVQREACRRAVAMLNENGSGLYYSVGEVRLSFPLRLNAGQVAAYRAEGDTLFFAERIYTGIHNIPLFQDYFVFKNFGVEGLVLGMDSLTASLSLSGRIRNLAVQDLALDWKGSRVKVGQVEIEQPYVAMTILPSEPDSVETESSGGWQINVDQLSMSHMEYILQMPGSNIFIHTAYEQLSSFGIAVETDSLQVQLDGLDLKGSSLELDLDTARVLHPYFDYEHLNLQHLDIYATDVYYDSDSIALFLHRLVGEEQNSGMQVNGLSVRFSMDSSFIQAQHFTLAMPGTRLSGDVELDYKYFSVPHPGKVRIDMQGVIASDEVIRQATPYLPAVAQYWPTASCELQLDAYAVADSIQIKTFNIYMPEYLDSRLNLHGVYPYDDVKRQFDMEWKSNLAQADFLLSVFVSDSAGRSFMIPDSLELHVEGGQHKGRYYADAELWQGGKSGLQFTASYRDKEEAYAVEAAVQQFQLQSFMPTSPVSTLTAQVLASGKKIDLMAHNAASEIKVFLDTIVTAEDDLLHDIELQGRLEKKEYELTIESRDPKLVMDGDFSGVYRSDSVSVLGKMEVGNFDISMFPPFRKKPMSMSFHADIEAESDWDDHYELSLMIDTLLYHNEKKRASFEDIRMRFQAAEHYLSAVLRGGDCKASLQMDCGMKELNGVIDSLTSIIHRQITDVSLNVDQVQQEIPTMDLRVSMQQNNPFYPFVYYNSYGFSNLGFHLSNKERLALGAIVVDYEDPERQFDTIRCNIVPVDDLYDYNLDVVHSAPQARRSYTVHVDGRLLQDSVTTRFRLINGLNSLMYDMSTSVFLGDDELTLRFLRDPIVYAQSFSINTDNFIRLSSFKNPEQNLSINADLLMSGPQELFMNLKTVPDLERKGNHLNLAIQHLDLEYLGRTVKWSTPTQGVVDLEGRIFVASDSLFSYFDLQAKHLQYGTYRSDSLHSVGHLEQARGRLAADAGLFIDGKQVLKAFYENHKAPVSENKVSALLDIIDFPLPLANAYLPNDISLDGKVSGSVRFVGENVDKGNGNGFITFNGASAAYVDAGAMIRLPQDTLRLVNNIIEFSDFKLRAANKNLMNINGVVDFTDEIASPYVRLALHGNNVQLFRSESCNSNIQSICGTLPVNVNLLLEGTVPSLQLEGNVSVLSNAELSYYMKDDPLSSDRKLDQLVEFVSFDKLNKRSASQLLAFESVSTEGFGMNIRVDIARNVGLIVYLPTSPDDNISVQGGGALQFAMGADGSSTLNGSYDINSGNVTFKLPMLPMSKSFKIVDGSLLRWSGIVDNPEMNITATEEVRCTINDESGTSRVVKFLVYVYIRNTVKNLSISFSCAAPEDAAIQSQINTLTDEERSKQALQLLVTQTYSGPGVTSVSSMASANAAINALLQKEVESFLNQRFKNTEVAVGIDTYDADGTGTSRTDYSVKISQRLLNNRMRIALGGRVSSGENSGAKDDDAIINDFSLEWLLKEDGSHYLRIFRKTNYESILEGEIVETGVGYVMQRSAYRLQDLFIPNSERRKRRMLEKMREWDINAPIISEPVPNDTIRHENSEQ